MIDGWYTIESGLYVADEGLRGWNLLQSVDWLILLRICSRSIPLHTQMFTNCSKNDRNVIFYLSDALELILAYNPKFSLGGAWHQSPLKEAYIWELHLTLQKSTSQIEPC